METSLYRTENETPTEKIQGQFSVKWEVDGIDWNNRLRQAILACGVFILETFNECQ